jgi:Zn finger protein HypA/HybF involved in hydrogenase expression
MGGQYASQAFELTNWPRDHKVREYLFDIYRTMGPKMWVEIGVTKIDLQPEGFYPMSEDYYHWLIKGKISRFSERPQHVGQEFELRVPMGGSIRKPVFTVYQIPLMFKRKCECCDDGTILDITEEGYVCPKCKHPRPPIRLGNRPEVHGTPRMCLECGVMMTVLGTCRSCPQCGKTSNLT